MLPWVELLEQQPSALPVQVSCQTRHQANIFPKQNSVFLSVCSQLCCTVGRNFWVWRRTQYGATFGKTWIVGCRYSPLEEGGSSLCRQANHLGFISSFPAFRRPVLNFLLKIHHFGPHARPEQALIVMAPCLSLCNQTFCSGSFCSGFCDGKFLEITRKLLYSSL